MLQSKFIYLVGPIAGCTEGQAKDWRADVRERLPACIHGVDPLRCEPAVNGKYDVPGNGQHSDNLFGSARAIASKNDYDVRNCDMVLAFLPKYLNDMRPSYGSIIEMDRAYQLGKPVILVTDDPYMLNHPLIQGITSWQLRDFDEALEVINGILGVYVNGS